MLTIEWDRVDSKEQEGSNYFAVTSVVPNIW